MLSYLIFGISYAFAAAVQPGPFQTFIISQTLEKGWRKTLPAAFAPIIGDIPIFLVVLLLLSHMPENFISILRISGGFFLLFLAYKAFKSWQQFNINKNPVNESGKQTLLNAIIINLLNPNPYLGWSIILGPLFLEGWNDAKMNGIALVAGFYLTLIITTAGIIFVFAFARKFGASVNKVLIGLSAIVLLLFGLYQLWLGILH